MLKIDLELYKFNELSEEAKNVAYNNARESFTDYLFYHTVHCNFCVDNGSVADHMFDSKYCTFNGDYAFGFIVNENSIGKERVEFIKANYGPTSLSGEYIANPYFGDNRKEVKFKVSPMSKNADENKKKTAKYLETVLLEIYNLYVENLRNNIVSVTSRENVEREYSIGSRKGVYFHKDGTTATETEYRIISVIEH